VRSVGLFVFLTYLKNKKKKDLKIIIIKRSEGKWAGFHSVE